LTGTKEFRKELSRLVRAFMPQDKAENWKENSHSRSEEIKQQQT
jgi:hypothetical protein